MKTNIVNDAVSDAALLWAYNRLLLKARHGDRNQVCELAMIFRPEVWDGIIGIACADIDHYEDRDKIEPYILVRDVCYKLLEKHYERERNAEIS